MNEEKKTAKLSRFEESIKAMSAKEAETIIDRATAEAEKLIADTEKQLAEKSRNEISEHKQRVKNASEKSISKASFDAGKAVLIRRNELVESMFADIKKKLVEFAAGDKYGAYLERCFAIANEKLAFYDGVVARCKTADISAVEPLAKRFGIKTEGVSDIKLGGIVFVYPKQSKSIDITLDKSLDTEREAFVAESAAM